MAVRSSSVSLPHFSFTFPLNCFQLPEAVSQFMLSPLDNAVARRRGAEPPSAAWIPSAQRLPSISGSKRDQMFEIGLRERSERRALLPYETVVALLGA